MEHKIKLPLSVYEILTFLLVSDATYDHVMHIQWAV